MDRVLFLGVLVLDLEYELLPLDLERDCFLLGELLLLGGDLPDLEYDLDLCLLRDPTFFFQEDGETLLKLLNTGDLWRDLESDLLHLGDLENDLFLRLGDLDLDLLLYEWERELDLDSVLLRLDLFLDVLLLECDRDLGFFFFADCLELDCEPDFLLVSLSLEWDLESLSLLFPDNLDSGDFDLLLEDEVLFLFSKSFASLPEQLLLKSLSGPIFAATGVDIKSFLSFSNLILLK